MSGPVKVDVINRLNRNLGLLQAGAPVTIDIATPAGKRGKFRTTFIGYLPKQYILIQFPEAHKLGGFGQYLTQGTNVTVRGLIEGHEGAVVAFVSPIMQTLHIPSRIMVLSFPKEVSLQTLRNNIRIETDINAKIKIGDDYWKASIMDLSIDGCQVFLKSGDNLLLTKDQTIEIVIEDFQDLANLKIEASVCNTKTLIDGLSIGIKFSESQSTKEQINKLLLHTVTGGD